ncbi:uncharacterized protein LOC124871699 [Girardinichthys multiradiatus]|uniref:uncharacterized protein LOC124871699 n=1 Tax=Girardinichthys multiradiatus TaxID=208333 RepID=UPI001FADE435|nr:uncharacterized protein LOC124871699 [Girardinichthys multiradiatus]
MRLLMDLHNEVLPANLDTCWFSGVLYVVFWLSVHLDQVRSVPCSPSNTSAPRCQQRLSCASRLHISRFPLAVLFIYNSNNARQISSSMLQHSLSNQTSVITDGTVVTQLLPYSRDVISPNPEKFSGEGKIGDCTPVLFFSRRLSNTERNYDVGDRELLAIKLALEEWRHWFEGAEFPIQTRFKKHEAGLPVPTILSRRFGEGTSNHSASQLNRGVTYMGD